jgi:ABC-type uncharacterized transport system involved in gliding motility auxiliary subunit
VIINQIKKFRHTKLWAATINIILAIFVLNLIFHFIHLSIDLTAAGIHTLSPATKKTLNQTDDLITIKAYISDNLPPQLLPLKETVIHTLNQYDRQGGVNIKFVVKNPQKSKAAESEAQSLGIPPIQFSSVKSDQYQIVKGYFGLAVSYAGKTEIVPALQEINNLEYRLTSTIKRLQKDKLDEIGLTTGSGEANLDQISLFNQGASVNYRTRQVDLTDDEVKLDNLKTLVIIGPKEKMDETIQKKLDEFLMTGKGLVLLLDKISIDQNLIGQQLELGLDDWLKHYGFEIENKLILDPSSAVANFQTGQNRFITAYPFWVKTKSENANQEVPVTSTMESVVFPWASPVKINQEAEFLWKTTPSAKTTDEINNIFPDQEWNFKTDTGQYTLAGLNLNKKQSYFNEDTSGKIKLAVISDADFITDQSASANSENINFLLNLIDYFSQDEDLIAIRSKQITSHPLKDISDQQKQTYKYAGLAAGPVLLLILAGVINWQRKKFNFYWQEELNV